MINQSMKHAYVLFAAKRKKYSNQLPTTDSAADRRKESATEGFGIEHSIERKQTVVNMATRLLSISARRNAPLITRISSSLRGAAAAGPVASTSLFGGITQRWLSSYPSHEVLGMPSLSPVRFFVLRPTLEMVVFEAL